MAKTLEETKICRLVVYADEFEFLGMETGWDNKKGANHIRDKLGLPARISAKDVNDTLKIVKQKAKEEGKLEKLNALMQEFLGEYKQED